MRRSRSGTSVPAQLTSPSTGDHAASSRTDSGRTTWRRWRTAYNRGRPHHHHLRTGGQRGGLSIQGWRRQLSHCYLTESTATRRPGRRDASPTWREPSQSDVSAPRQTHLATWCRMLTVPSRPPCSSSRTYSSKRGGTASRTRN